MGSHMRSTTSSNISCQLHLPRIMRTIWIVVIVILGPVAAVPVCQWQGEVTRCSVIKQSDFAALPTNVTQLLVFFPPGHQTALRPGAFPVRPNLVELTLDISHVDTAANPPEAGLFSMLEPLTSLTFVYNHEYYAPAEMTLVSGVFLGLPNLRELTMSGVGIVRVEQGTFQNLPSLVKLDLGYNQLPSFPGAAFTGTTELVTIVLSNNKLGTLVDGTFSGLNKLQTLNLENNKLEMLGGATFGSLPALNVLSLEGNLIRLVGPGTFQGLPSLTTLQLQNNELARIDSNIFKGLSSLDSLDLSRNKITEIADLAFSELTSLQFLEIFENSLKHLTPMTFLGLGSLSFLDLYVNNLQELQDNVFQDLHALATLHLHEANISKISAGAFNGLNTLNILTLQQNNLMTLPEGVFDVFEQLAFLDISMNPWNCSCDITWLHPWSMGQNFGAKENTMCTRSNYTLFDYASKNYDNCLETTTIAPTTTVAPTTTPAPITTDVAAESTSADLYILTTPDDSMYTTNSSRFKAAEGGGVSKYYFLITVITISCVIVLAVIIAVIIVYCRQKKCAFWTPEHISGIPTTPASAGLDKDISHFAYSPTKDQTFFADQGTLERRKGKSNLSGRSDSAYDNPALYLEDNVLPQVHGGDPAVVAYVTENGITHRNGHLPHSYEHRVSDSGTHYVDRVSNPPEDLPMNDLNQAEVTPQGQKPGKKDKKRKQGKKQKKASISSSDNGDDPYSEIYASQPIPLSDMIPSSPEDLDRSIKDTSLDSPDYHKDYPDEQTREHDPAREQDSALGASTEEPFDESPSSETPNSLSDNIPVTDNIPANNDNYTNNTPYYTGDEGSDAHGQMKHHSDSLGENSDYVDYRHSYGEEKPAY